MSAFNFKSLLDARPSFNFKSELDARPSFNASFMGGTRDVKATPTVYYDGPPEFRQPMVMEARKFLGYLAAINSDLPYGKFTKRLPGGAVIEVQSINHTGKTDIVKIFVPKEAWAGGKKKKRSESQGLPVPLIILNYDSGEPLVRVFKDCKTPMERFRYPSSGTDVPETYKPYGIYYDPSDDVNIDILSLEPIQANPVEWWIGYGASPGTLGVTNGIDIVEQITDVPLYSYHVTSAVVVGKKGYTDYKTWALVYAVSPLELGTEETTGVTITLSVYIAFKDPVTGFRTHFLEDVDHYFEYTSNSVTGLAKVDIFDYYGTPYFVSSYVGIFGFEVG